MTSKITAFVSHEDVPRHDTGWNHPDHQGRIPAIARAVYKDMLTLFEPMLELSAVPATDDDLRLVHTAEYLRRVREAVSEVDGVRVSQASDEAARASVGGALTAVDAVLAGDVRNAFVLARPPGRDALPDAAAGFSIFNTVAITARHLHERRGIGNVLVVSWGSSPATHLRDVLSAPWLQMIDIHTPGNGGAFADALRGALGALPSSPEFVILSAGFDILAGDPVGTLAVEPREVYDITLILREWADQHASGRLVSVLDGGYDAPRTARAVVQHLRALIGLPPA